MPTYEISSPDGRRFQITAPEGATQEQILSYAQSSYKPAAQPEFEKPEMPGIGESMLIGAGRGTDKLVQGVRQLYNGATGDQKTLDAMASNEAEKDRFYKPLQEAHPIATAVGETVPLLAMPGGASLGGAAIASAVPGLIGYGSAEERLKRGATGAMGGVAGNLGGKAIARVLKPAGVGVEAAPQAAMDAAQRIGYRPLPSQIANNPGMASFENYLLRTPGSSGTMQKVASANQTALNKAGAKAMGETADTLDEGVFAAAQGRIGSEFDRLSQVTKPDLTHGFLNTLAKIDGDNAARGSFASPKIKDLVDKGLDLAANNNLSGKAYKEVRTELSNQAQAAFKAGDATSGQAYKSLVSALDDAAKGSLSKADQKAWDVARKEWGAFKTMSKSNVAEAGNVSAARTAAAVRSKNPSFRTGGMDGELADIARVGEAFKGVANPNSGQLAQQMLFSNPFTGLPLMAANKAAAAAYMSPIGQRYFSRGLLDVGQAGQGLLSRAGGQLAVPGVRGLLGVE